MADDERGREDQARDEDRRQRERDVAADLERGDETEPPVDAADLEGFEAELRSLSFPAAGAEVVEAVGDRAVEAAEGSYTVADLVPETDDELFTEPAAVRVRVQRPTVAEAMKRVVEASEALPEPLRGSQREAYEKTFRALENVDADDDDRGIRVVRDWLLERIRDDETLPGSRAVRREAAPFCRESGYDIRDDEWLGV
jgi:hypothetical protein